MVIFRGARRGDEKPFVSDMVLEGGCSGRLSWVGVWLVALFVIGNTGPSSNLDYRAVRKGYGGGLLHANSDLPAMGARVQLTQPRPEVSHDLVRKMSTKGLQSLERGLLHGLERGQWVETINE